MDDNQVSYSMALTAQEEWDGAEQAIFDIIALGQRLQQLQSKHLWQVYKCAYDISVKMADPYTLTEEQSNALDDVTGDVVSFYTAGGLTLIRLFMDKYSWVLELPVDELTNPGTRKCTSGYIDDLPPDAKVWGVDVC